MENTAQAITGYDLSDLQYHRFSMFTKQWVATTGIMQYCENNKCNWVLDVIASYIPKINKKAHITGLDRMLLINVEKNKSNDGAKFSISHEVRGTIVQILQQRIPFTDLEENLKFWAINESGKEYFNPPARTIVLLPEEY